MYQWFQIRRGISDNLRIIFPTAQNKNIHCDPSLERSRWDSSNEGPQCMFSLRNKINYHHNFFIVNLKHTEFCIVLQFLTKKNITDVTVYHQY